MKPVQLIAVVGGVAILGIGGWYLYMRSTPTYEKAASRGLDPGLVAPATPATAAAPATMP